MNLHIVLNIQDMELPFLDNNIGSPDFYEYVNI